MEFGFFDKRSSIHLNSQLITLGRYNSTRITLGLYTARVKEEIHDNIYHVVASYKTQHSLHSIHQHGNTWITIKALQSPNTHTHTIVVAIIQVKAKPKVFTMWSKFLILQTMPSARSLLVTANQGQT
jgi:hypothetical protein